MIWNYSCHIIKMYYAAKLNGTIKKFIYIFKNLELSGNCLVKMLSINIGHQDGDTGCS